MSKRCRQRCRQRCEAAAGPAPPPTCSLLFRHLLSFRGRLLHHVIAAAALPRQHSRSRLERCTGGRSQRHIIRRDRCNWLHAILQQATQHKEVGGGKLGDTMLNRQATRCCRDQCHALAAAAPHASPPGQCQGGGHGLCPCSTPPQRLPTPLPYPPTSTTSSLAISLEGPASTSWPSSEQAQVPATAAVAGPKPHRKPSRLEWSRRRRYTHSIPGTVRTCTGGRVFYVAHHSHLPACKHHPLLWSRFAKCRYC
jgi:hypothetical protein